MISDDSSREPRSLIPPTQGSGQQSDAAASTSADGGQAEEFTWQRQVARKVHRYRSRRSTRAPRYPSLSLSFASEPVEKAVEPRQPLQGTVPAERQVVEELVCEAETIRSVLAQSHHTPILEATARVLEFPRAATVMPRFDELAEPMPVPRILEVPESVPTQPALGGIEMETEAFDHFMERAGIEIPRERARRSRRLRALAVDVSVVLSGLLLSAAVFWPVAQVAGNKASVAIGGVGAFLFFWGLYQYLFMAFSGTTPGLRWAELRVASFNGSTPTMTVLKRRAVTSVCSATALGLGFAWCAFDDDGLFWHERVTKTVIVQC